MGLFKLLIIFAVFPLTSIAETHYLLIDGGIKKSKNYYRYYNSVRRGYEVTLKKGKYVKVIAKDGSWKMSPQFDEKLSNFSLTGKKAKIPVDGVVSYPPITSGAKYLYHIVKQIEAAKLKKEDQLVIFMTGHGYAPSDTGGPRSSSYSLWDGNYASWKKLSKALEKFPDSKIKIVSTVCFGGGAHYISRELPNVCSVATAPYFTSSSSGSAHESIFSKSFWNHIKDNPKASLSSASNEGFKSDYVNPNLGSLSSLDYVNFVLKKFPYDRKYDDLRHTGKNKIIGGENIWLHTAPDNHKTAIGHDFLDRSLKLKDELCSPQTCFAGIVQSDLAKINKQLATLSEIMEAIYTQRIKEQPKEIQTIFHDVIDDMKKNGIGYLAIAWKYDRKYQDLKERWNAHEKKWKDSWDITKNLFNEGDQRAKMQKEFDDLKIASEKDLRKFSFNHQMLGYLDKLEEFNKKAEPDQKRKFVQLLQCEWEPL